MRRAFYAAFILLIAACAGQRLSTVQVYDASAIGGSYRLILWGANHHLDIETVSILDLESDEYTIAPAAPSFNYSAKRGLDADAALRMAGAFIEGRHGSVLRAIIEPGGRTIGYEMRPLYMPLRYGVGE